MLTSANLPGSITPIEQIPPMLFDEIGDVRTVEVARGVDIGYTLLNKHLLGDSPAIVAIGGFMSSLTSADRAYEGVQLASLQRPVLMLDLPGHGKSSPHNKHQIIDLCIRRHQTADSQAAPLTEAVQRLLPPNDVLDMFGVSHGSLMAFIMTSQDPGDRINTVFGLDVPAVKKRLTLALQFGYIVKDNILGKRPYIAALKETTAQSDYETFKSLYESLKVPPANSLIRANTGLFFLNLFRSINATTVALDAWQQVMDTKSASINAVISEKGSVSDATVLLDFVASLPEEHRHRSSITVVPDENHNIGKTELLPRAVLWAEAAYKQ